MMRGPWRLQTQITVLVLSVLLLAQAISLVLFVDERGAAIQAAIGAEAAGRAANVARLIERAPERLHRDIIDAASSPLVRFELSDSPKVTSHDHQEGGAVEARVRALLADSFSRDIRVEVHAIEGRVLPLPNLSPEMAELHEEMMRGTLDAVEMELSIGISGGRWLNVGTLFERPPLQWSWSNALSLGLTAAMLLIASFFFILTRLTGPLRSLAAAAERFGRGASVGELQAAGPREVREVTNAFNKMQHSLTRFISDRTQMLAALAHDLRSPLTAMRVRAEMVSEKDMREHLVKSMDEFETMVDATLAYAKGVGQEESPQRVELADLVHQACVTLDDRVRISASPKATIWTRATATRRALRNLVDNAIRYGNVARIGWKHSGTFVELWIDDDGPGIPKDKIDQMFSPYVRLDTSRSRQTGGHGLGLSIARGILLAQGGSVRLGNRPEGGLRAIVKLPLGELSSKTMRTGAEEEPGDARIVAGGARERLA